MLETNEDTSLIFFRMHCTCCPLLAIDSGDHTIDTVHVLLVCLSISAILVGRSSASLWPDKADSQAVSSDVA